MNYKILYLTTFILLGLLSWAKAQVDFTIPDTICAGDLFAPVNQSGNASSYFWHFCSGNLNYAPSGANLGNPGYLSGPAFITIVQDTGGYYAFITNHTSQSLTRYKFGNSLLNTPVPDDLGTFGGIIPEHIEGIQVKKDDDGNWYGFIAGGIGGDETLIRFDFGPSLENSPTAVDLGNIGSLDYPIDFYLLKENNTWIGFTVNYGIAGTGSVTRFVFTNGLANPPTAKNMGNIGNLNHPCGIYPFSQNGNWYLFITNLGSSTLTRLDLGSSLLNTPTGQNLGNMDALTSPFDLAIIRDCGQTFGFVVNRYNNDVVRLDFPQGIEGPIVSNSLGNIGDLYNPHGISEVQRVDNEIFVLVANADNNTISRLYYTTCTEPSILTSTDRDPPQIFYTNEGNYNISLTLDEGLSTESMICKNIVVKPKPTVTLGNDTTICPRSELFLDAGGSYDVSYVWSTGSSLPAITVDTAGAYWVIATNDAGCSASDSITISHFADDLFLGNDTSFTPGQAITLDAGTGYQSYSWSTGNTQSQITVIKPGTYAVTVTDSHTCTFTDTITLTLSLDISNFFTPNGDGINDTWEPKAFFHYPEAEIKIFDRFGKLLASYRGSDPGWNGIYNGHLVAADTYWYVIDLKNGIKPITGQITIKR